ncbi:MAG: hypothetical protein WA194_04055 [Patescibacteria group bacterium]
MPVASVAMVVVVVVPVVVVPVVMVVVVVVPAVAMIVVSSSCVVVVVFVHGGLLHSLRDGRHGSYDRGGNDVGEERAVDAEEDPRNYDRLHVGGEVREGLRKSEERHERLRFL